DPIRIQKQSLARVELQGFHGVLCILRHAKRPAASVFHALGAAVLREPIGEIMTTVTVLKLTGAEMEDAAEDGHKHAGLIALTKLVVQHGEDKVGSVVMSDRDSP